MGKQFSICKLPNQKYLLKIIIDGFLCFSCEYKTEKQAYAELIALSKVHMNLKNVA